jgi:hypothetical protein
MGSNLTADEVEKKYIEAMGAQLGPIFNRLQTECTLMNSTWRQFVELFGTSQKRVEVLAWSAEYFFEVVREVFLESTLLKLCRITDPASSPNKKKNVTVALLTELVDDSLRPQIASALPEVLASAQFARDWRNRHIAHQDFDLIFADTPEPLAVVTRKKVSDALEAVNDLLNIVENHYSKATMAFDHLIARGQADDLVQVLNEEFQRDFEFRERLRLHQLSEADLKRTYPERI